MAKKHPKDDLKEVLGTYEFHGVDVSGSPKNGHIVTDCPFCGKEKHFYIRVTESARSQSGLGSCDCKRCGFSGNKYNFLHQLYNDAYADTTDSGYNDLVNYRRELKPSKKAIGPAAYKDMGLALHRSTGRWLFPVTNPKGSIVNLKALDTKSKNGYPCPTTGCAQHLYNAHELNEKSLASREVILLCEGEWDAIALHQLIKACPKSCNLNRDEVAIVSTSASQGIPEHEIGCFADQEVWVLFDCDDAGRKGIEKVRTQLSQLSKPPKAARFLAWPESTPDKHDLYDTITASPSKSSVLWNEIQNMTEELNPKKTSVPEPDRKIPRRTKFSQIISDFRKSGVYMSKNMVRGLAVGAATILTSREKGDPAWVYIVGPSGCGKSLILESFMNFGYCEYRGSVGAKDFLSGFKTDDGEDPSLLGRLVNPQKCLLVKDYTGILSLPDYELKQLYGVFREAFDGRYSRGWGNNVQREYEGYFTILAGVTPKIHILNDSDVGERFLKFILSTRADKSHQKAILSSISASQDAASSFDSKLARQDAMRAFLEHKYEQPLPDLTSTLQARIEALATFVALSRAKVDRDRDGAVRYEPAPESPTRVSKQLTRLAQGLCLIMDLKPSSPEIADIVVKLAWDSATGRLRDALWALYNSRTGISRQQLQVITNLPSTTAHRVLDDLHELQAVSRKALSADDPEPKKGRPSFNYKIDPDVKAIIARCKFKKTSA